MEKMLQAIKLYKEGVSARTIAQVVKVSHTTVLRWIKQWEGEGLRKSKKGRSKKEGLSEELKGKLKKFLEHKTSEKGKTRILSLRQIYKAFELECRSAGICSVHSFYRYVKKLIKEEYGSLEKLEAKRRDRKEIHQYRRPKGRIERRKGWIEVDATGYSYGDKLYSILMAQDEETGFILGYFLTENKEKETRYYNKAFNETDYMYFLLHIFKEFGIPTGIKTDNEKFLTSRNVQRALRELDIQLQRTKPYAPQQKLIERAFRDIKEKLRLISAVKPTAPIDELVEEAINIYNKEEHQFVAGAWVPAEKFEGYEPVDSEDRLRLALSVEEERAVVNGYIRFENKTYEFRHEELENENFELGRRSSPPRVMVRIDLEDNTKAYIFKDGRFLGVARAVSPIQETSTIVEREEKRQTKRIERRKRKLQEELYELENSQNLPKKEKEEILDALLQTQSAHEEVVREEKREDILELLLGGET